MGAHHVRRPDSINRTIQRATAYINLPWQNLTGRARWHMVAPRRRGDYYISIGHHKHPYGRSTHTSAYLTHIVYGVLMVWRHGRFVGAQVIWRCNARSTMFYLIDEPTSTVCPACKIERVPRER